MKTAAIGQAPARRASTPTGAILYDGPSQFDGGPIVALVTFFTTNRKTGNMPQTWILNRDATPVDAKKRKQTRSICGTCPIMAECYVNIGQAPQQIHKAHREGKYPEATARILAEGVARRSIRLGAYGDPAAVPLPVWQGLLAHGSGRAGYTHDWREARTQPYRELIMASVETEDQAREAQAMGWRTYRVRPHGSPVAPDEIVCPGSEEGGYARTCQNCGLCDGSSKRRNIVTLPHGRASRSLNRNLAALADRLAD